MLCLTVSLLFLMITFTGTSNVGTTIFYGKRGKGECWTQDEVAKLRARKLFEGTMPAQVTPDKVDTQFIKDALRFYRGALRAAQSDADFHNGDLMKQALADTIGGHLRNEMLPTVRFAYYAGYVPYRHVKEIHDYLDNIKTFLNTKGMGWKEADKVPQWANLTVVKVLIGSGKLFDPCACLVTKRDSNTCIHLPCPKLDDNKEPTAIVLPFKIGGLVSLTSPNSENILLKYYTTAARCILRTSPEVCRHSDFVNFNNELWHWMKRDVAPHLIDEKLYVAYGGVLRIAAAVQGYGKGLTRRNLFDYQESEMTKWHPWQALTQSYVYLNTDWTPKLYVGIVFLAALAICLLQICYNYMFGESRGCSCTGRTKKIWSNEVNYSNVDSTFPSMLPSHHSSDKNRHRQFEPKTKSLLSLKTQRVYDFNENTEKLMEVIMSGNEDSDTDSHGSLSKQEESEDAGNVINLGVSKRQKSPPELHTPVAQLRIEKRPRDMKSSKMFTSTASHSNVTYCQEQQASESVWSESASTSSGRSASTDSSQTLPSRRSRSSRDLAWARRVASKHSLPSRTRSTTNTEFDVNSFTTPPSRR